MNYYDAKTGTIFGIPTKWILIGVAITLYFYYKGLSKVGSYLSQNVFGESIQQQKEKQEVIAKAETSVKNAQKNYGLPTANEKQKADSIYNALNSLWGNDSKAIDIILTISGKYEANRVFSAFGVRTIEYGVFGFRTEKTGNLLDHIGWSDIDIMSKKYKTKEGLPYSLNMILSHIEI